MTQPVPPQSPGERRLDRPPSDRYATATTTTDATAAAGPGGSLGRGLAAGLGAGIVGAIVTAVLGGGLGVSAGLLVVAGATGWAIGSATRIGGGSTIARSTRPWLAIGLTVVAVVLGQVGLWLYARTEGGVLTLPDYLGETWGFLVPLQALIAVGAAWWAAR